MTRIELINKDIDNVKLYIQAGMFSCAILRHLEIYCRYELYKKMGKSLSESILNAADDFQISEVTMYAIKKQMESEI
jgi:hypothetical protein